MLKKVNSHIQFSPLISSVIALSAKMRGTSGQICECPLYFQNKNFTCAVVWRNDVFTLQQKPIRICSVIIKPCHHGKQRNENPGILR